MSRHLIKIERNECGGLATNSIGTDALNAISSIPGAIEVELDSETKAEAIISFGWDGPKFWDRDTHLAKFNLRKKED